MRKHQRQLTQVTRTRLTSNTRKYQRQLTQATRTWLTLTDIPEVLGESDTRVDGSLTGGHGHVRRVCDEGGALHDAHLLAGDVDGQLGELVQHL